MAEATKLPELSMERVARRLREEYHAHKCIASAQMTARDIRADR
jgi:hypothetical protein